LSTALVRGDLAAWRDVPLTAVEQSGRQELLNWFCLAGAMHELGAKLGWSEFVETHVLDLERGYGRLRAVARGRGPRLDADVKP